MEARTAQALKKSKRASGASQRALRAKDDSRRNINPQKMELESEVSRRRINVVRRTGMIADRTAGRIRKGTIGPELNWVIRKMKYTRGGRTGENSV
jgi:hypothetical protein